MASIINKFQENYSIITIHGTKEIYIENFITISTLTDVEVTIKSKNGIINILGSELLMEYFNKTDIKISGTIFSINFKEVSKWPS